jgi:hypothetical protein
VSAFSPLLGPHILISTLCWNIIHLCRDLMPEPKFHAKGYRKLKAESSFCKLQGLISAERNCALRDGRQAKPKYTRQKLCHNDLTVFEIFPELLISFAVFADSHYLHIILILSTKFKRLYWLCFFIWLHSSWVSALSALWDVRCILLL